MLSIIAFSINAKAQVILSDNFTATGTTDPSNINYNLAGRQTGSAALQSWTAYDVGTSLGVAQVGNTTSNVGQPVGTNGNYLYFANKEQVSLAGLALTSSNVNAPLLISFDMYSGGGPLDQWTSFSLTPTINPGFGADFSGFPIQNGPGAFGFLAFGGGGIDSWASGTFSGGATQTSDQFSLLLTGVNGTGSAFAGNGTQITLMNGSSTIGTYDLTGNMTTAYLSFGTSDLQSAGINNLLIETAAVPEPSAYVMMLSGLGVLLVALRRRRA